MGKPDSRAVNGARSGAVKILVYSSVALVILTVAVFAVDRIYERYLRGVWPAILPPAADISKLLPLGTATGTPAAADNRVGPLTLPAGFSIEVFAKGLGDPRVLVTDPNGVMVVSVPARGQVLAFPNGGEPVTVASGLNYPHGLAFRCISGKCSLYVGDTDAIFKFDYDPTLRRASNPVKLADLPTGGNHITRSLLFLPPPNDDRLLVSIGSSCNVCRESDARRATIMVIGADGGELKPFAKGLRNSVFMTVEPDTKEVWAADMGRDLLGDNLPPDEINIIQEGKNYGWPICYGKNFHDTEFDKNVYVRNPCMEPFETPSHIDIPAHSAPLGLAWAEGSGWTGDYAGNLFVAYHGSWNRSVPTGYKVVRMKIGPKGEYLGIEDFITGWLQPDGSALGRPTGLLARPDGELFVADDKAGVIYRVFMTK